MCFIDAFGTSNAVQTKRVIVRRVGSTYSHDFIGLVEVSLFGERNEYRNSFGDKAVSVPKNVLASQEPKDPMANSFRAAVVGSNMVVPMLQTGGRLLPPSSTSPPSEFYWPRCYCRCFDLTAIKSVGSADDAVPDHPCHRRGCWTNEASVVARTVSLGR